MLQLELPEATANSQALYIEAKNSIYFVGNSRSLTDKCYKLDLATHKYSIICEFPSDVGLRYNEAINVCCNNCNHIIYYNCNYFYIYYKSK